MSLILLALVGPPAAAALSCLAGVAVDGMASWPARPFAAIILLGPGALAAAALAAYVPAGRLWRVSRLLWVLYVATEVVAAYLAWSNLYRHFVTSWR